MTETISREVKYKESKDAYKATLYRSAFAIRKELEPSLKQVVDLSGASSVSNMLTLMCRAPEECAQLLKPVFERMAEHKEPRRKHKITLNSIVNEVKSGEVSAEDLAAALAMIKAQKGGAE